MLRLSLSYVGNKRQFCSLMYTLAKMHTQTSQKCILSWTVYVLRNSNLALNTVASYKIVINQSHKESRSFKGLL